jgi:hypothetical protein
MRHEGWGWGGDVGGPGDLYLGALYVLASFAAPLIPLCRRMPGWNPELLRGSDFGLGSQTL